jgi:site-specific DNA recombinase
MAKITVIPSTINPLTRLPNCELSKRKVAGYARVSTDSDEQFTSYEAQVDYYTKYIKSKPEWNFVNVYTDEGISGTNTKKREGFKKMISDALAGKIDLIVTKSVSRFARNTVDSLVTIRKLKDAGVECYFEKENIYTFDGKGELLITIMSSLAQEESRSISENITWGQRKSFSDGKVHLAYKHFLGYKKGSNSKLEIIEEEAKIVRKIYELFIKGKTTSWIAKHLTNKGIKTPANKDKWQKSTVDSILTNEKYKGDALLQKKFTVDFLEKKMKKNEGEIPQYYVENSHPAIIDPVEWEHAQVEFARRVELGRTYSSKSIFSSKLVCEDCGGFYGQKVWHSTSKYRRVVWQCNKKFKNKEDKCKTPTLTAEIIQMMFLNAYNTFMGGREQVIEDCEMIRKLLLDFTKIDVEIEKQTEEIEVIAERVKSLVKENASTPQSQDEYIKKYNNWSERYEVEYRKLENLQKDKELRISKDKAMEFFIMNLKKQPLVVEVWDESLWPLMIEKAIVGRDGSIKFIFYNGTEIREEV